MVLLYKFLHAMFWIKRRRSKTRFIHREMHLSIIHHQYQTKLAFQPLLRLKYDKVLGLPLYIHAASYIPKVGQIRQATRSKQSRFGTQPGVHIPQGDDPDHLPGFTKESNSFH